MNNTNNKATKQPITKRVGDAIENIGDKIEHSGMPGMKKVGDSLERMGDKVEHLQDEKTNQTNMESDTNVNRDRDIMNDSEMNRRNDSGNVTPITSGAPESVESDSTAPDSTVSDTPDLDTGKIRRTG